MKLILFTVVVLLWSDIARSETIVLCKNHDEYYRAKIIEIRDFSCDEKDDCGLVASVPKNIEGTKFYQMNLKQGSWDNLNLLTPLQITEKQGGYEVLLYGRKDYLESLELYATYKPNKGCYFWSILKLKHNKDEMSSK